MMDGNVLWYHLRNRNKLIVGLDNQLYGTKAKDVGLEYEDILKGKDSTKKYLLVLMCNMW